MDERQGRAQVASQVDVMLTASLMIAKIMLNGEEIEDVSSPKTSDQLPQEKYIDWAVELKEALDMKTKI